MLKYGVSSEEEKSANDRRRVEEGALIGRILGGEKELFQELVRPYQRTVYAMLVSMLKRQEDVQDVAQDVMLKALGRLGQFRGESAFGTWLIQIAVNQAKVVMRKLRNHGTVSLATGPDPDEAVYVPRDFADWREIPSQTLERTEVREALAGAFASLAQHYREVFVLRDINNLSITETALALGISRGAVKSRLHRARLMLRDMLAPGLRKDGRLAFTLRESRK